MNLKIHQIRNYSDPEKREKRCKRWQGFITFYKRSYLQKTHTGWILAKICGNHSAPELHVSLRLTTDHFVKNHTQEWFGTSSVETVHHPNYMVHHVLLTIISQRSTQRIDFGKHLRKPLTTATTHFVRFDKRSRRRETHTSIFDIVLLTSWWRPNHEI